MTQYLAAFIGFAAALVGIIGDTWDAKRRGFQRLTPTGRLTVCLATLSLGVSLVETYRDHRTIDWQARQREEVRLVAHRQVLEGIDRLLNPFRLLLENIHWKRDDLDMDVESIVEDPRYAVQLLQHPAVRTEFEAIDLLLPPQRPDVFPEYLWWQLFSRSADDGDALLNEAVAKFSGYLEADTLVAIEELRADEFFRMRLRHLPTLVSANDHSKVYPVASAFRGPDDYAALDRLLSKINALLDRIDRN